MIRVEPDDIISFGVNSADSRIYVANVNLLDDYGKASTINFSVTGAGSLATAVSQEKRVGLRGWITSAVGDQQTRSASNTGPGTILMACVVFRSGSVIASLFSDYYYTGHPPQFPSADTFGGTPFQGRLFTFTGSNDPANGAEVADTVPVNQRWRIWAIEVVLVTDANVANRLTNLFIDDAGGTITRRIVLADTTAQTATQTRTHSWIPGTEANGAASTSVTDGAITLLQKAPMSLQGGIWVKAGDNIRTVTTLIQATDNYGTTRYIVEAFFADVSGGA